MRVINTPVFILTAGILCHSIALGYSPSEKGLIRSILELSYSPNSTNLNISDEKMEIITELLKESCTKNGGPKAYETMKKGWQDFFRCGKQATSQVNRKSSTAENDLVYEVRRFCAIAMLEEHCIEQFKDTVEPCLELGEQEAIERFDIILISLLEFMCKLDGARITKFIADGGIQCVQDKKQDLLNCPATQLSTRYNPAINPNSATGVQSLVSRIEECIEMQEFQLCCVKLLSECQHHAPADIVDALFVSIRSRMKCETMSHASVSSDVDVILITIAMAIFLHFD